MTREDLKSPVATLVYRELVEREQRLRRTEQRRDFWLLLMPSLILLVCTVTTMIVRHA